MALQDGAFGACQVTSVARDTVTVCVLNWHTADPPELPDLADAGPLEVDHHAHPGGPCQMNVDRDGPVPPAFTWIGTLPVVESMAERSSVSFSGWGSLAIQAVLQYHWAHVLPESSRDSYRVAAARGQVRVDFGAGPVTLGAGLGRMDLTEFVPAEGPVRWSALEPFGRCTHLRWAGLDRGLVETIGARPITSGLDWRDAPATVNLTGTGLFDISVSGPSLRTLRLPRSAQSLTLTAPDPALAVYAVGNGRWLRVAVLEADEATVLPAGLRATRALVVDGGGTLSADTLHPLAELRELTLSWRKPPGSLTGTFPPAPRVAVLYLRDGYGLRADSLPNLPALAHLTVDGLRRSIVPALKARYRATPTRLVLRGAKNDTWLAANLDNPFRDWVDQDPRSGRAACNAYARTVRAIDKAATSGADPVPALRGLIHALNRLEFLDTINREQAGEAFDDLVTRAGVPKAQGDEWFDEWREF